MNIAKEKSAVFCNQRIKILIERFPIMVAALLSFSSLFLISIFFHFTFCADDYAYLARVYSSEGLTFSSFGPFIYRVPLWSFFTWGIFHIAQFVPIHALIYLTILIFCIAFAMLAFYVYNHLIGKPVPLETLGWIITTTVFALFPNYYEILYWPTCMTYIPGMMFMALAFRCRRSCVIVFFLMSSFLTSEMYILPALAYTLLSALVKKFSLKALLIRSRFWIAAIFFTLGIKGLIFLTLRFQYRYDLRFEPFYLFNQIKTALIRTWTIHFYKTNYLLSFIYLAALILVFYVLYRKNILSSRFFRVLLGTAFLVTAIYWFYGHQAIRSLFAAQVYIVTILVFVFIKLDVKTKIFLPILFIVFIAQNLYVYSIKDKNYHILKKRTAELISQIEQAKDPCVLEIEQLNAGLKRDWVLPSDYWEFYLQWLNGKYFPNKLITFKIKK